MSIVFQKENAFWWPVDVMFPDSNEEGEYAPQRCRMKFKMYSVVEYQTALNEGSGPLEKFMLEQVEDWDGINNENGKPIKCTVKNKLMVFSNQFFNRALVETLIQIQLGTVATKN